MSNEVCGLIWRIAFPTLAMKIVALKLADHADSAGENIFPSIASVSIETGCSESTVRDAIALMESCGVLIEDACGNGNARYHSTTRRRFEMDTLQRLACTRRGRERRDSTHVFTLACRGPEPDELTTDGKPRRGKIRSLMIDPRTPPESGGVGGNDPSGERRGTPPESGGVDGNDPSGERRGTPPESGGYPSGERRLPLRTPDPNLQGTFTEPPLSRTGESKREGGRFAELIDEIVENKFLADALKRVCDAIAVRHDNPRALFAEVNRACCREPFAVLAEAAQHVIDTRTMLTAPKQFVEAVALAKQTTRSAGTVGATLAPPTDEIEAARWADLRAGIASQLGEVVTAAWFSDVGVDRYRKGYLTLRVANQFLKSRIENDYREAVRVAARCVWPDLVDVQIEVKAAHNPPRVRVVT